MHTSDRLRGWIEETVASAARLMQTFEQRHGFPPGDNVVVAGTDGRAAELSAAGAPAELVEFYRHVRAVVLPDVENGWFIHPAEQVLDGIREVQPTELTGAVRDDIVVFATDGGGALYAMNRAGDRVYRLAGGALPGSTYDADESDVTVVAHDLWGFLETVRAEAAAVA
ncbi:hypothetical protein [Actinoplanes sp. URMC 104]|uniref:hypothetical protein n=1 Tax=Actinoplanes sp. URMC 104 TaxID=3423409 RepID=UPI003F1BD27C